MKQRIVTGVLAASVFLAVLAAGNGWYTFLIIALALVAYYEFVRLNGAKSWEPSSLVGFAGIFYLTVPWGSLTSVHLPSQTAVVWLLMFLFFAITVVSQNRTSIDKIALLFIGVLYIGVGFHYMIITRLLENGLFWTLLLFGCIWLTDVGAYFTGKAFGKHLLWPSISPKKTVEGAVGGVVISLLTSVVFCVIKPEILSLSEAVLIGITASVLGQLGDLIQSAYKRVRGVKDSGNILPGHGGILDRTDSWIIVFPFMHLLGLLPM
ncbi:phosphatidate cytidylyltransferase [Paenibacillus thermotolerans]|uniref:phosphatidate cytidylyltransferase n=1 Tax=Paenibacillus thermotolerans TaxID=3027807 RepID=UPI0023679D8B|nr:MULTISPECIES: phosphatidate cytidylyltransferase [unclassified Paenibacillus]